MKRDQLEANIVVGVVAGDVNQGGITGLSSPETKRQLIVPRIYPFHLSHRVRQYSRSMPAAFQSGNVTAELVRYAVCIRNIKVARIV